MLKYLQVAIVVFGYGMAVPALCPPDWTLYRDECFVLDRNPAPWFKAETHCKLHGGILASAETLDKDLFLRAFLEMNNFTAKAFLGGRDQNNNGQWTWVGLDIPPAYQNWPPQGPDRTQHCMSIDTTYAYWHDDLCTDKFAYLCQRKIRPAKCPPM